MKIKRRNTLNKPKKFEIEQSGEIISGSGGLVLVGKILSDIGLPARVNHIKTGKAEEPEISNAEVVTAYVGLLCQGRTAYEEVEPFRNDRFFKEALGLGKVPSAATLRQRFDAAGELFAPVINELNAKLLASCCSFTPIATEHGDMIPIDVDVSPFDNSGAHKEGVSRTYKNHDGYAPIFAYIGAEGHMINCELRPGKQHCQNGTPEFLRDTIKKIDEIVPGQDIVFRLDSGNDAAVNLGIIHPTGKKYLIKRNLRKESLENWLEIAKIYGEERHPRDGKTVWMGSFHRFLDLGGDELEPVRIVFEVTERTVKADGLKFLIPELEVDTYWTNLQDSPEKVVELYHDHGTSEQYHSELKSDMDVERLPSGKFATNALILQTAMVAFNFLRKIGQDLITKVGDLPVRTRAKRKRLRKVIQDVISWACKFVTGKRRRKLKGGAQNPWFEPIKKLYQLYC